MTKRKVIEDSDDEENEAASPSATGLSDITLSPIVSLDGIPPHEIQEQNADPSTSSTELLNRESRDAYRSLIEPTPRSTLPAVTTYDSSQQQTSTSPTTSQLKTKRSKTSIEKQKAKKPLKTYGKSSQDICLFHGGSDGELDMMPRTDLGHKAGKCRRNEKSKVDQSANGQVSQDEDGTGRRITSSGGDTELLSTAPKPREISSTVEKNVSCQSSMPPPASKSTSSEHSQRSENGTMSTTADPIPLNSATGNLLPTTGAIYSETQSDDRMPTPTQFSRGEVAEGHPQSFAQSVQLLPRRSNKGLETSKAQPTEGPAPSPCTSEISPSKSFTVERTNQTRNVSQELSSHVIDEHLRSQLDSNMSTMVNPVVVLPTPMSIEGGQDELSLSIPETASKSPTKPEKPSKRKREMDDEIADELEFDDNAIGLPKEHYQPRPSKRRSGGRDEEIIVPTDFSKRPEAMSKGKRKTKRHKTTAFQELLLKDEDEDEDEEVKVVSDPRFEIPDKKMPYISKEGDRTDVNRDNTEEIQPEAEREPKRAAEVNGQKKRGRPKKVAPDLSEETVVDQAEAGHDEDDPEAAGHVIPATTQKPRKKTKTKETLAPMTDKQDRNNDGVPAAEADPEDLPANTLSESHGNIIPLKLAADPLLETSPAKTSAPPETPRKSTTPAPKGPDKHSPISSGKVAYRVGLSKRARIAPLLRIVRK